MLRLTRYLLSKLSRKFQGILAVIYFNHQRKNKKLNSNEIEHSQLTQWIKKGDNVIDIGSNIGRYTFKIADIVGQNGHVYSIEPLPGSFFILSSLSFLGNFKNITLMNIVIGKGENIVNFEEDWTEPHRLSKNGEDKKITYLFNTNTESKITKQKNKFSIKRFQTSIDNLKISEKINFIKIDVEGNELDVLEGSKEIIARDKPTILIELLNNEKATELNNYFENLGYKIKILDKQSPNIIYYQ